MDLSNPVTPDDQNRESVRFLARVDDLIDWVRLAPLMDALSARVCARAPMSALKLALLERWYGLEPEEVEFAVLDRTSFRDFVGYSGDGGLNDDEVLSELRDRAWRRHPDMDTLVRAVDDQLRTHSFGVRNGHMGEPSLQPSTEAGMKPLAGTETALFERGELGRMLEAATAKAHAEGRMPTGPQDVAAASGGSDTQDSPALPGVSPGTPAADPRVRAVLEWPWGERSALVDHLNIGRDYGFSPLARELAQYTHMSRRHAELLVYGDGVWVRDLGSRNGTFVNGEEVPKGQAYLIDSDCELQFGPDLPVKLRISA